MANTVTAHINQVGPTTSQGEIRGHTVLIDRPRAKGGEDRGAMGGEYLLVALGGCFNSNLLAAIHARGAAIANIHIALEGTLEGTPPHYTRIHMAVAADYEDRALMERLIAISERSCIVANTLKDTLELTVSVGERAPAS